MNAYKAYSNTGCKPSEEAKINAEINHALKLDKYRKEHADEIMKYKNDKAFLNVIKKKQYTIDDYKELPTITTFTTLQNEIVDGHNGYINIDGDIGRIVDLESLTVEPVEAIEVKDCSPIRKRGRPKKYFTIK